MSSAFSISTKSMGEMIAMSNANYDILVEIVNKTIGDGSPKEVFDTLEDLVAAYPEGEKGIYLVTQTGHWYFWHEEWIDGGVYQATQLSDGSVTEVKLELGLQNKIELIPELQQSVEEFNDRVNKLIIHNGDGKKDSEIIDARGSAPVLSARLNGLDAQLADIAVNVTTLGIAKDGSEDAVSILQAYADSKTKLVLLFPPGRYKWSGKLTITDKQVYIYADKDAVFVETEITNLPMIELISCDNSQISGLVCEGVETFEEFSGVPGLYNTFIKLTNSTNTRVSDIKTQDKSFSVVIDNCINCSVTHINHDGFLIEYKVGSNYSSAVASVNGGVNNSISDVYAQNIGTCYTALGVGIGNSVSKIRGANCQDNGVYVSSGNEFSLYDIRIDGTRGTGVKVRGSKHTIKSCHVKNCGTGYMITGNGVIPDGFNANGYGNTIDGCIAENCLNDGINIGSQDGYFGRNFVISNCTFKNIATSGGAFSGIRGAGFYHKIVNNTILDCGGDYGIYFAGSVSSFAIGAIIDGNTIIGVVDDAIRLQYVTKSVIARNIAKDTNNALEMRNCTDNEVEGNIFRDSTGTSILCINTYSNTGNKFNGNVCASINFDKNNNYAMGNIPVSANYQTNISAVPYYVGQLAIVSGVVYMATGTTGPTDWKQISNQV